MNRSARAEVREHPILFSGEMVRAILDGRKSQTRRVVKMPVPADAHEVFAWHLGRAPYDGEKVAEQGLYARNNTPHTGWLRFLGVCPYGQPGDRLWVRETFYIDLIPHDRGPLPASEPRDNWRECVYYRADGECCQQIPECACGEIGPAPWRPSIHMPRWASRLTLEVTEVRVERVQDISEQDALAEGSCIRHVDGQHFGTGPRTCFMAAWWTLNEKRGYGWDANPWVWVIGFRRLDAQHIAQAIR